MTPSKYLRVKKTVKKCFFLSATMVLMLIGCDEANNDPPPERPLNYQEAATKYLATNPSGYQTFLNFRFGMSKKQVRNHIDSLIRANKIDHETTLTFETIGFKTAGYPYNLYLSPEKKVTTIFDLHYLHDSLYKISILPYGDYEENEILRFLEAQYGEPAASELDMESSSNSRVYYWFKNDYEVSYSPRAFYTITFANMKARQIEISNLRWVDSTLRENRKDAAAESKSDFN